MKPYLRQQMGCRAHQRISDCTDKSGQSFNLHAQKNVALIKKNKRRKKKFLLGEKLFDEKYVQASQQSQQQYRRLPSI